MHFTKTIGIVLAMLATGIIAIPAAAPIAENDGNDVNDVPEWAEIAEGQDDVPDSYGTGLTKRGFGCPGNRYECNNHCRSIGRKGGYCGGKWWLGHPTCICIKN